MEPDVAEGVVEDELPPAVQERVEGAPEMQGGQGAPAATSGSSGLSGTCYPGSEAALKPTVQGESGAIGYQRRCRPKTMQNRRKQTHP